MFNWIRSRREAKEKDRILDLAISYIQKLSPEKAREIFLEIDESVGGKYLRVNYSDWGSSPSNGDLPKYVKELFRKYSSISLIYGEVSISQEHVKQSELHSDCLIIGTDMSYSEVVIRPQQEDVYVLYNDDPYTEIHEYLEEGYPSIYNYLLDRLCIHNDVLTYVQNELEIT